MVYSPLSGSIKTIKSINISAQFEHQPSENNYAGRFDTTDLIFDKNLPSLTTKYCYKQIDIAHL